MNIIKFLLSFCIVFSIFHFLLQKNNKPEFIIEEIEIIQDNKEFEPFKKINEQNANIKSIFIPKVKIVTSGVTTESEISYQKPMSFRMITYSTLSKEFDIGSNDKEFWFWSKRLSPPALYHTSHENLYKTYLKTPFHPKWLMDSLVIGEIPEKCNLAKYKEFVVAFYDDLGPQKQPIIKAYVIDPKKLCIVGHYLYTKKMQPIIGIEIKDFWNENGILLPKSATVYWTEENIQMNWSIEKPILNKEFSESAWKMPDVRNKINLDGYLPKDARAS